MPIWGSLRRWLQENIGPYPGDVRVESLPLPMELPRERPTRGWQQQARWKPHPGIVLKSEITVWFQDMLVEQQWNEESLVARWLRDQQGMSRYVTFEVKPHALILRAYADER